MVDRNRKSARVLLVGMKETTFARLKAILENNLKEAEWTVVVGNAPSFAKAERTIAGWPGLDLICISNELGLERSELVAGCEKAASIALAHANAPWFNISPELPVEVMNIFCSLRVRVESGQIENICALRSEERVRESARAAQAAGAMAVA